MKKTALLITTGVIASFAAPAFAGTPGTPSAPPPLPPAEPFVTGNLTLAYDTHFVSYGQDVWGAGSDWNDGLFHPSLELDFNIGNGWQIYLNTWFDVNDNAVSSIGGDVQEVDVNVGVYYTKDKWKFQLGYGAWMYADQVEHIIDAKVSYSDGFWNPFVMLHGRAGDDLPFDTGVVAQLGIAPSKTFGAVTVSMPVTVSFDTDNFHGGDSGFAYASVGLGASVPLWKHTTLNIGATYYHTNEDVIPVNPDEDFVTGSAGITISF